jgi:hypothetical protein
MCFEPLAHPSKLKNLSSSWNFMGRKHLLEFYATEYFFHSQLFLHYSAWCIIKAEEWGACFKHSLYIYENYTHQHDIQCNIILLLAVLDINVWFDLYSIHVIQVGACLVSQEGIILGETHVNQCFLHILLKYKWIAHPSQSAQAFRCNWSVYSNLTWYQSQRSRVQILADAIY